MSPTAAAAVRFVVIRNLPLLVVDLEETAGEDEGPDLYPALVERGVVPLPGFYGRDLPRGAQVGVTLTKDELKVEDEQETRLLRLPRESVPADWEREAKRLKGTMFVVGRGLGVDPDQSTKELCDLLDTAAKEDRLAGAIVGVAEPQTGLPLFSLS